MDKYQKYTLSISSNYNAYGVRDTFSIAQTDIDKCKTKVELEELIHSCALEALFENIEWTYWKQGDSGEDSDILDEMEQKEKGLSK